MNDDFTDLTCARCGHDEDRHQSGTWCIEDDCKAFVPKPESLNSGKDEA